MIKEKNKFVEQSQNKFKEITKDFIVVCPKCYNLYNNRDKIESYLNLKKVIENL